MLDLPKFEGIEVWVTLVSLASLALVVLAGFFMVMLITLVLGNIKRQRGLIRFIDDLPGCRMENLDPIKDHVDSQLNREFVEQFARLVDDSKNMFDSVWLPRPPRRLTIPEILPEAIRRMSRKTNGFAILLGGFAMTAIAISVGTAIDKTSFDFVVFRMLSFLPLVSSAICLLILNQTIESYNRKQQHIWQLLMTALESKLPIYSEAAETARLISEMREYDAHMAKSVAAVATHVQQLASGKLSESITAAVKYVMAATVAPAVVKSTESLGILVSQLDKQMQITDSKVAKLYADLETRQEKQGELWLRRYQDAADMLASQQDLVMRNVAESGRQLVEELGKSQKFALEQIVEEQQHTMHQANNTTQRAWSSLQEKLTDTLSQLAEGQTNLLDSILKSQTAIQREGLQQIQSEQKLVLDQIEQRQNTLLEAITANQAAALSRIADHQELAIQHLAENFGSEAASQLAKYLDPISVRLHEASEALIVTQNYSKDVGEVLRTQNQAAAELQTSINDLYGQLLDTRKSMTVDLASLKTSSSVMSKAAEVMGSVYEGSQSGLSEAISQMSKELQRMSEVMRSVMDGSAEQSRLIQNQSIEAYEINQKHLEAVRGQVNMLSDELSNRIDQLMLGFTNLTNDLVSNVNQSIVAQNDTLGGSLRSLTEIMGEEARSMSLFAQQINMDIETLNENLRASISDFDSGMRQELTTVLSQFDSEVAEVVKRLSRVTTELGDAVDSLPQALRTATKHDKA